MVEEIRELYAYNRWANRRILDATAGLTPEALARDLRSSFPSVRDTLVHVLGAEWLWLERWRGISPTGLPEGWELPTHAEIRARWERVEEEQAAFLSALTDHALRSVVEYRNTAGEPFAAPLWQIMRHVVNHSTYHRGQVVTLLRQLGSSAPATDLVLFHRERIRENGEVFDFRLTGAELEEFDALDEGLATGWDPSDAP